MKFKYKEYGNALRPVVPVTLEHSGKCVRYEVLIDSGSDHCFFDTEIGEKIGIRTDNSKTKEVFGVGGKISLYYDHEVTLKIGNKSFETDVGFMPNLGGNIVSYGIVGQKGFFDKFIIKFDYAKGEVEIKEKK
ncbi:MAG: retropepsin-like aspartic protease [Candidatus Paceibacterota bacterium]|jgi:hypothetical protein